MSRTTRKQPQPEPAKTSESESALRRWSRRKHEARTATQPESLTPKPDAAPKENNPERVLTDADMPPLETLNEHSDYSPFMSPGVSDALRRAALRRLFNSPEMNVLCELEGEYYDTRNLTPLGNIVTYDMRAALKREIEQAKSSAEEKLRTELAETEESEIANEASETGAESADRVEADAGAVAVHPDENSPNDRGAT